LQQKRKHSILAISAVGAGGAAVAAAPSKFFCKKMNRFGQQI